jgi:hypothetical protein
MLARFDLEWLTKGADSVVKKGNSGRH